MPRIEIWKAKPSWQATPLGDRNLIIHRLAVLVKRDQHKSVEEDGGPYVIQKAEGILLIWTTELNAVEAAEQYVSIGLEKYFEPLVHTAVTKKLNAKVLARKLSG
jgi:hypothetical protein